MTAEIAQVQLEVRQLRSRVAALEQALAERPVRRKREPRPRPTNLVILEREKLWAEFVDFKVITKLSFAMAHRLNPSEFGRWLSANDRRGIPAGSGPDLLFRKALTDAIKAREGGKAGGRHHPKVSLPDTAVGKLTKDRSNRTLIDSLGKTSNSQFSRDRPH